MKKMKRLLGMLLSLAMVFALAACSNPSAQNTQQSQGGEGSQPPASSAGEETPSGEAGTYLVGICQQMTHDALDAATEGFKAALTDIFGEGVVEYTEGNASGEFANCGTIVDGFIAEGVDLILANATYPLQAARSATDTIPVWVPLLRTMPPPWRSKTGLAPWGATSPAPPTWPLWTSRRP